MARMFPLFGVYILFAATYGAIYPDLERLHDNLTANYKQDLRPTYNLSEPTIVNVTFQLLSIMDLEAKTSKLAIVGILIFVWNDFKLRWNPADYGNIETAFLPQNSVWKPEVVLLNPYNKIEPYGHDRQKVRVVFDGDVYWAPVAVYESTCPLDITMYPFDEQTCYLVFNPWMYSRDEVFIQSTSSKFELSAFYPNGLWELTDTNLEVQTSEYSQNIFLKVKLKRHPMYQVLNTLVPISVMGLLNIMVFLLPAESGERVGFSVTVLLAMAVYMTMVTDNLPSTSEPAVSILCYLFTADLCINTLVTMCAILGLRLYHRQENHNVPRCLQCFVDKKWRHSKNGNVPERSDLHSRPCDTSHQNDMKYSASYIYHLDVNSHSDTIDVNNINLQVKNDTDINTNDTNNKVGQDTQTFKYKGKRTPWMDVAFCFDIVFFIIFLLVQVSKSIAAVLIFL